MTHRSASLLLALGLVFTAATADPLGGFGPSVAFARSGGGNGGGNGGGHGGGNSGGNSAGHSQSSSHAQDGTASDASQGDDATQAAKTRAAQERTAAQPSHISTTKANAVARELGNLNAAHASTTALANAAPTSMVGKIATYDAAMRQALTISDPVSRALAINAARADLATVANKPLTAPVVARVDRLLGLPTGGV